MDTVLLILVVVALGLAIVAGTFALVALNKTDKVLDTTTVNADTVNTRVVNAASDPALSNGSAVFVQQPLGTNDYFSEAQHFGQVRVLGKDEKALEMAVLDNGTAIIQANEVNVGYNELQLNPVAGNVDIGKNSAFVYMGVNGFCKAIKDQGQGDYYRVDGDVKVYGGDIYVEGEKVVGPQEATVADLPASPTVEQISTTVNTIIARLEQHGLIAS